MAEHGDNYQRTQAEDGSEVGKLGPDCGHHCGVQTVGQAHQHIKHCNCPECHFQIAGEIPTAFVSEPEAVDPRDIR